MHAIRILEINKLFDGEAPPASVLAEKIVQFRLEVNLASATSKIHRIATLGLFPTSKNKANS